MTQIEKYWMANELYHAFWDALMCKQRAYLPVVFQRIHELYGLVYCPIDRLEQVFVRDESEFVVKFKKVD